MNLSPAFFDHVATSAKLLSAFAVVLGIPASVLLIKLRDAQNLRRARAHLAPRPPLDPTAFAATYFPADHAALARRLHELLAPHLPLDLTRLHPDDRLVEDLRMDALDSMSTIEFILAVEKEFSLKIPTGALTGISTLRDLTTCIAHLLAERASSTPPTPPSPCQ